MSKFLQTCLSILQVLFQSFILKTSIFHTLLVAFVRLDIETSRLPERSEDVLEFIRCCQESPAFFYDLLCFEKFEFIIKCATCLEMWMPVELFTSHVSFPGLSRCHWILAIPSGFSFFLPLSSHLG